MMTEDQYFYCYNKQLSDYLTTRGIRYINIAISPKDKRLYSLYKKDNKLDEALKEYKQNKS